MLGSGFAAARRVAFTRHTPLALGLVVACLVLLGGRASVAAAEETCPVGPSGGAVIDWGQNIQEQLGLGFHDGHEPQPGTVVGTTGTQLAHVRQAQAGFEFTLALTAECRLKSWGANRQGQLGDGNHTKTGQPQPVVTESGALTNVKQVSVGNSHPIALRFDSSVWTWGAAEFGERGNGERGWERTALKEEPTVAKPRSVAIPVETVRTYREAHPFEGHTPAVRQVASGGKADFAVLESGEVLGWGADPNGWLGVEATSSCHGELHAVTPEPCVTTPVKIPGLSNIERVSVSEYSQYAIVAGGTEVFAWGKNAAGQLGDGTTTDKTSPTKIPFTWPSPVVEISSQGEYALALLQNGNVYGWGVDGNGQLGIPAGGECGGGCYTTPTRVASLSHVVQVSAGLGNSIVLKEELSGARVPYVFGYNGRYSMLGLGNWEPETLFVPGAIPGLTEVANVSTSSSTVAAALESEGPAPIIEAKAGKESISVTWRMKAEGFKLRYREVGETAYTTKTYSGCGESCSPVSLEGLASVPYEVNVATTKVEEGKTIVAPYRKMDVTPLPPAGAPINTAAPSITTSEATSYFHEGQELLAQHGSWEPAAEKYTYQWLSCKGLGAEGSEEELGAECVEITGATGATYTPSSAYRGTTIAVEVKAENTHGASTAVSQPELVLGSEDGEEPPAFPVATGLPAMSGTPLIGTELKALHGTWTPESPATSVPTLTDKWFACRNRVSNPEGEIEKEGAGSGCREEASGPTFTPTEPSGSAKEKAEKSAIGRWIEIQEHGKNAGGGSEATSEPVKLRASAPPENLEAPTIEGLVEIGQSLKISEAEHEGSWANETHWTGGPENPAYQWYRCAVGGTECSPIASATKKSYKLVSADAKHAVEVEEIVHNEYGAGPTEGTAGAKSAPSSEVPAEVTEKPKHETLPVISGTAKQGEELSVARGTWSKVTATPTLSWKRCNATLTTCTNTGEKGTKYVLHGEDVGERMVVSEHAVNSAGSTVSESTGYPASGTVVAEVPLSLSPPVISGAAQEGETLTELHGTWSNEPLTGGYSYRWLRCNSAGAGCMEISGQTAQTYTVKTEDVGSTIRAQETASNATAGAGAPAQSAHSSLVVPLPPANTGEKPSISPEGTPEKGATLTAHTGVWTPEPTSYSYKWLRCEAGGSGCTAISGATASTYVPGAADVEHALAVEVRASNVSGWDHATSTATAAVAYPTPSVTALEHAHGPLAGGRRVTINGHHLGDATSVHFGANVASGLERLSENSVTAMAPAGEAGTVDITATTPYGTTSTVEADRFTYDGEPSVSSIAPPAGPTAGGTWVKVNGADLNEAEKAVKFGLSTALAVRNVTATSLEAETPSSGAATVDVTIETATWGESPAVPGDRFRFIPPPAVTGLSVSMGTEGTVVTVTGTSFVSGSGEAPPKVRFGTTEATSVELLSETSLKATAPKGTGTVDVIVETLYGTSEALSADHFTYEPPPSVTGVTPNAGPLSGEKVTIAGTSFLAGPKGEQPTVKAGSASATEVVLVSSTQMTAKLPSGSAGTADVTVTSAYGTSTTGSADHFTYMVKPEVTGISPGKKGTAGGKEILIEGSGFTEGSTVKFGEVTATVEKFIFGKLVVEAPPHSAGIIDVTVTTPGGTSATSSKDHFTYAPEITSIAPKNGPVAGGTSVTIEGTGFATGTTATTVKFGTVKSEAVSCASSTKCTATSPKGTVGKVEISVTVNGANSPVTSAAKYTYE